MNVSWFSNSSKVRIANTWGDTVTVKCWEGSPHIYVKSALYHFENCPFKSTLRSLSIYNLRKNVVTKWLLRIIFMVQARYFFQRLELESSHSHMVYFMSRNYFVWLRKRSKQMETSQKQCISFASLSKTCFVTIKSVDMCLLATPSSLANLPSWKRFVIIRPDFSSQKVTA